METLVLQLCFVVHFRKLEFPLGQMMQQNTEMNSCGEVLKFGYRQLSQRMITEVISLIQLINEDLDRWESIIIL